MWDAQHALRSKHEHALGSGWWNWNGNALTVSDGSRMRSRRSSCPRRSAMQQQSCCTTRSMAWRPHCVGYWTRAPMLSVLPPCVILCRPKFGN